MAFDPNPGGTDTDYDLVLIGRGYSIATYLLMADLSWAQRIAILGGPDAWDQQLRGDGIVNHAQFLVDPRFAERLAVTQEATKRADFLASNASVFEAARDGLGDNQPIVWPGGEPTGLKTAFGKDAVSQVALDGSVPFLVVSVTPVREAAGAPIQRGVKYTGGGPAPALDLAQGARLCVYEIGYKDAGAGDTTNPKRIRAMRVVFGGGAGPHRVPGFAAGLVDSQAGTISYTADDQVMDLDGFMRRFGSVGQPSPELAGQTVAVIGPNAGVDAAVTALQKQAKLKWLISGRPGSKPAWLATEHYDPNFGALRDEAHRNIVNFQDDRARQIGLTIAESGTDGDGQKVYDVTLPDVTQDGQTYWSFGVSPDAQGVALRRLDPAIFVRLTGPALTFKARFIVYAIGQDPTLTEKIGNAITRIGPAKVLQKPVLDSLVPLYDVNQRFGPPTGTVLGLATRMAWDDQGQAFVGNVTQAVDLLQRNQPTYELYETDRFRGLEVVGAAVFALRDKAVPVEQFTRKEIAQQLGEAMSNLPKALRQKAVATADQLAALRSGIEAATGADFRNQVSTMTGFQVAEANYREAVAAVQQDTGVLGEHARPRAGSEAERLAAAAGTLPGGPQRLPRDVRATPRRDEPGARRGGTARRGLLRRLDGARAELDGHRQQRGLDLSPARGRLCSRAEGCDGLPGSARQGHPGDHLAPTACRRRLQRHGPDRPGGADRDQLPAHPAGGLAGDHRQDHPAAERCERLGL